MATLNITIPDEQVLRVRTAFGFILRANPVSNTAPFDYGLANTEQIRGAIVKYVVDTVKFYEQEQARVAAANVAGVDVT